MTWVGWRQQRAETVIAAAILLLLAAVMIPTGLSMASAYDHGGLSGCLGAATSASCGQAVDGFLGQFRATGNLIAWLTLIPGVVGILLAAPFVGQLERGTYRLDWTQSITRGRWIAVKLGMAVATALLAALALTLLVTWWRSPFVHLQGRISNSTYDSEGTVVFGYTLFALGLALAIGAVWRRTAAVLVVALAGFLAVRFFVDLWLRQRLVAPVTSIWKVNARGPNLDHAWVLSQFPTDVQGHRVPFISCPHGAGGACHPGLHRGYIHAVYQPAGHFWALQTRETALFVVAALLLMAFAAYRTQHSAP